MYLKWVGSVGLESCGFRWRILTVNVVINLPVSKREDFVTGLMSVGFSRFVLQVAGPKKYLRPMTSGSVTPERWNLQHKETSPTFRCGGLIRFFRCTDYVFLKQIVYKFSGFHVLTAVLDQTMSFWFLRDAVVFNLFKLYSLFLTVGHVCKQSLFMGGSVDQHRPKRLTCRSLSPALHTRRHTQFPAGEIVLSQSIVQLVHLYILLAASNEIGDRIVGPGKM